MSNILKLPAADKFCQHKDNNDSVNILRLTVIFFLSHARLAKNCGGVGDIRVSHLYFHPQGVSGFAAGSAR